MQSTQRHFLQAHQQHNPALEDVEAFDCLHLVISRITSKTILSSQRRLVTVGHLHADAMQDLQSQRELNLSLGPNLVHSGIAIWRRPHPPSSRGSNPQLHRHPRAFLTAEKVKLACMHCLASVSLYNCLSSDVAMHVMLSCCLPDLTVVSFYM